MRLTSRQAWVLGIALVVVVALVAYGFTHPGCASVAEIEGNTYCYNEQRTVFNVQDYGRFYFLGAAAVALLAIIAAASPWGRRAQ